MSSDSETRRAPHRAEVPHGLLDRPCRQLGAFGEERPLVGVLGEQRDGARQLVAGGVGARHQHRLGQHRHLVGREPVSVLLDGDEVAQEIVSGIGPALCDQVAHVGVELLTGALNERQVLGQVVVEDAEDVRGPGREQLPVLGRRAEQLADDGDRVGLADVGHELALAARDDAVDQLADHGLHGGPEPVGRRRCEGRRDEATESRVARALHREDGLASLAAEGRALELG